MNARNVQLSDVAKTQFTKIQEPFHTSILKKLKLLQEHGMALNNVKALAGNLSGYYRLRIGKYRAILMVSGNTIFVTSITLRRDAYE